MSTRVCILRARGLPERDGGAAADLNDALVRATLLEPTTGAPLRGAGLCETGVAPNAAAPSWGTCCVLRGQPPVRFDVLDSDFARAQLIGTARADGPGAHTLALAPDGGELDVRVGAPRLGPFPPSPPPPPRPPPPPLLASLDVWDGAGAALPLSPPCCEGGARALALPLPDGGAEGGLRLALGARARASGTRVRARVLPAAPSPNASAPPPGAWVSLGRAPALRLGGGAHVSCRRRLCAVLELPPPAARATVLVAVTRQSATAAQPREEEEYTLVGLGGERRGSCELPAPALLLPPPAHAHARGGGEGRAAFVAAAEDGGGGVRTLEARVGANVSAATLLLAPPAPGARVSVLPPAGGAAGACACAPPRTRAAAAAGASLECAWQLGAGVANRVRVEVVSADRDAACAYLLVVSRAALGAAAGAAAPLLPSAAPPAEPQPPLARQHGPQPAWRWWWLWLALAVLCAAAALGALIGAARRRGARKAGCAAAADGCAARAAALCVCVQPRAHAQGRGQGRHVRLADGAVPDETPRPAPVLVAPPAADSPAACRSGGSPPLTAEPPSPSASASSSAPSASAPSASAPSATSGSPPSPRARAHSQHRARAHPPPPALPDGVRASGWLWRAPALATEGGDGAARAVWARAYAPCRCTLALSCGVPVLSCAHPPPPPPGAPRARAAAALALGELSLDLRLLRDIRNVSSGARGLCEFELLLATAHGGQLCVPLGAEGVGAAADWVHTLWAAAHGLESGDLADDEGRGADGAAVAGGPRA